MAGELINMQITGFRELYNALNIFPDQVAQVCEAKATLAGAKYLRDTARNNFAGIGMAGQGMYQRTGRTLKNIKIRKTNTGNKWLCQYVVGISRYGMFIELGTKTHILAPKRKQVMARYNVMLNQQMGTVGINWTIFGRKAITHPGTAAHPFLRPAFYNNIQSIIERERLILTQWINVEYAKSHSSAMFTTLWVGGDIE
jgi:hypothetical protein